MAAAAAFAVKGGAWLRLAQLAKDGRFGDRQPFPLFSQQVERARLYAIADRASWLVKGSRRCLTRSLILCWLLRQRGEAPKLQLGVARTGCGLRGHAYVTINGRIFGETEDVERRFKSIASFG